MTRDEAIEKLTSYCQFFARKYAYINKPRVETDDLFQEAMLAILRHHARAHELYSDDPMPYLKRAVRHAVIDFCFRSYIIHPPDNSRSRNFEPYSFCAMDQVAESVAAPTAKQSQMYLRLYDAIARLPERQRAVIELRFGLNGRPRCTQVEANQLLGTRSASAYQVTATRHLRRILSQESRP